MASALHSSASSDWGTPVEIVDWARALMGGIDLDPASSAERNEVVRATRFIDEQEDGLTADWGDAQCVLLNAPGERTGKLTRAFYDCACSHVWGSVDDFRHVVWIGFSMSHLRFMDGHPTLIFRQRIPFLDGNGNPARQPTHDNFIALISPSVRSHVAERFLKTKRIGPWSCYAMERGPW